jgi:Dyp-type peroxidase family
MLDFPDIQSLVLSAHGHLPHARFLFLQVQDRAKAKEWLQTLLPAVENAIRRPRGTKRPPDSVQVAFTASGLAAYGLTDDALQTFPREFLQGMGHGERTRVLGDVGDSAPEQWQVGGTNTPEVHVLLLLYSHSYDSLDALTALHWNPTNANSGLTEVFRQDSMRRGVNEPFGFRDGISQPGVEGVDDAYRLPGQPALKPGEFILGYTNEYGQPPPMPTVAAAQDTANLLPPDAQAGRKAFGRNGTYFVWRKLRQDVAGFWKFLDEQTQNADGSSDPDRRTWLAAKMVGRWPSGAPLTLCPDKDDPELGADPKRNNNFTFLPNDAEGRACPIGSHIRRGNPRDTLPPNPGKSVAVSNRHRLLRRGRPYDVQDENGSITEQGLLFMAVNADIQRQFEFVQQTWLNSTKFGGLTDSKDPVVSDNDGTGVMVIQARPARQRLHGLPRFVHVLGGGYFFLPGISALRFLAA